MISSTEQMLHVDRVRSKNIFWDRSDVGPNRSRTSTNTRQYGYHSV